MGKMSISITYEAMTMAITTNKISMPTIAHTAVGSFDVSSLMLCEEVALASMDGIIKG
jgi:hypothetical protein